jgi:hypothetical protein
MRSNLSDDIPTLSGDALLKGGEFFIDLVCAFAEQTNAIMAIVIRFFIMQKSLKSKI